MRETPRGLTEGVTVATAGQPPSDDDIAEAYDRFQQGETYRQIGRAMGITHPTAAKYVRIGEAAVTSSRSLNAALAKDGLTRLLRELTVHTAQLLGLGDEAMTDDEKVQRLEAVGPELKWQVQELAKLTGAYAPVRQEVTANMAQNSKINEALERRRQSREQQERQAIEDGRRQREGR